MENYIIYNIETGAIFMRGSGPEGATRLQTPPPGFQILKLAAGIDPIRAESEVQFLISALWDHVKAIRANLTERGINTTFGVVDSDETSRLSLATNAMNAVAAKLTNASYQVTWTLKNDTEITLDADELISLNTQVTEFVNKCHDRARVLRKAIEGALSVNELLTLEVSSGWL